MSGSSGDEEDLAGGAAAFEQAVGVGRLGHWDTGADPDVEPRQVAQILEHRRTRDAAACDAALQALRAACQGTDNTMPLLIDAANKGATLGEMCDVFRDVWGVYRDPARW